MAGGDVDALADMTQLATELDEAIAQAVTGLRIVGYSWAEIVAWLGVTRQQPQQRWAACRRYEVRRNVPEMSPNRRQQPTIAACNNLRT